VAQLQAACESCSTLPKAILQAWWRGTMAS
jgi:hypothetical protein